MLNIKGLYFVGYRSFFYFCSKIITDMNEKSIKLIQELLSGKAVLLTDENLENFLQKCKLTCSDKEEDDRDYLGLPRFVTGLKSLAAILKVSLSTVSRWKAEGLLDTVTFQDGKSVFFDVYGVLDLLRVSNQKGKYNQPKYNNKN